MDEPAAGGQLYIELWKGDPPRVPYWSLAAGIVRTSGEPPHIVPVRYSVDAKSEPQSFIVLNEDPVLKETTYTALAKRLFDLERRYLSHGGSAVELSDRANGNTFVVALLVAAGCKRDDVGTAGLQLAIASGLYPGGLLGNILPILKSFESPHERHLQPIQCNI